LPRIWSIEHDPSGSGVVTATLDGKTVKLELTSEMRKADAAFDRFGCLSFQRGGLFVEMYFDDIEYTTQH
jgi:hypothetical protein